MVVSLFFLTYKEFSTAYFMKHVLTESRILSCDGHLAGRVPRQCRTSHGKTRSLHVYAEMGFLKSALFIKPPGFNYDSTTLLTLSTPHYFSVVPNAKIELTFYLNISYWGLNLYT